jgi:GNAT superfamily N-acetyltransferase
MSDYQLESKGASTDPLGLLQEFVSLPAQVRQPPHDIGLLSPDAETLLLVMPGLGERELWVARKAGSVVARIGASVSPVEPTRGSIGFLELKAGHEQAGALLITAAERWLALRGATRCYGPLCFNTWFPYRYRIDSSDALHFRWEPVHPPTYPELLRLAGYEQDATYHSKSMEDIPALCEGMRRKFEASEAIHYRYQPLADGVRLEGDIPELHEITTKSFHSNHMFEPIPLPVFEHLYVAQARRRGYPGACFAVAPDGSKAGFMISFVDEAGQFVLKSIAVVPEHQGRSVAFGLVYHSIQTAVAHGCNVAVSAMVQDGSRSEFAAKRSSTGWHHRYALFCKPLP